MTIEPVGATSLPQTTDTPISAFSSPRMHCLLASWRSADAIATSTAAGASINEDAVTVRFGDERIAFAVCDGVSQSFAGHLASAHVAAELVAWLWRRDGAHGDSQAALAMSLTGLAVQVRAAIALEQVPQHLPAIVREALAEKRELGSETTFAAALIDLGSGDLVLTWMGDTRLRAWGAGGEELPLEGAFDARERWSSRRGLVGRETPHLLTMPLAGIRCVIGYSDGLSVFDSTLHGPLSAQELEAAFGESRAAATSDDASVVQVRVDPWNA